MLILDVVGMIVSTFMVGLRYAHYVWAAAIIGAVGSVLASLFVNAQVDMVVAAGVFSRITVHGVNAGLPQFAQYFGGPLVNYFVGMACGGLEKEKFWGKLNPFARVSQPFAVINIRLAVLSVIYNAWQYLLRNHM